MDCLVTTGPTYEPLDEVRRLTNFSTGKLGSLLADYLVDGGHEVTLLRGHCATYQEKSKAQSFAAFTTTADLKARLQTLATKPVHAVYHAAAVSDFAFGKVWERTAQGELIACTAKKISTRHGTLLAELSPTPKLIAELRAWFPNARLVGWKYEVDGERADVIRNAEKQIAENRTNACVANGPAYGFGFGLVRGPGECAHFSDTRELFAALVRVADG